jgi:hypothetical protein
MPKFKIQYTLTEEQLLHCETEIEAATEDEAKEKLMQEYYDDPSQLLEAEYDDESGEINNIDIDSTEELEDPRQLHLDI